MVLEEEEQDGLYTGVLCGMEEPKWNSFSRGTWAMVLEEEEQGGLYTGGGLCRMENHKRQHKWFLFIAGVPNTTHVTQIMDVSFNPFKTAFRSNKKKLHAYRRSNKQTVKTSDIPALVFGYKETVNRACWAKIGIAPFTRKCLGDRNVAHELMTLADGTIDVDVDPKTVASLELERRNQIAVQTLVDHGFNGGDQHIVYERVRLEGKINAMKETRTASYTKNKETAEPIMEQCNGNFMDLAVFQLRKVFEWKLQEKSTKLNKDDMLGALMETKDNPQLVYWNGLQWMKPN
eukprot:jgi/Psemu1/42579/gm1.42579_g